MKEQAKSISELLAGYSSKQRASASKMRVYEKGNIFRLYISKEQAQARGLVVNAQGFISLNKLSEQERKALREQVEQEQEQA